MAHACQARAVPRDGAVEAALPPRACAPGHVALQEQAQEEPLGVIDLDSRQRGQGPVSRPVECMGAFDSLCGGRQNLREYLRPHRILGLRFDLNRAAG